MMKSRSVQEEVKPVGDEKSRVTFEAIWEGMQRAVEEAVADHLRVGNPVAIWRDGQVVLLHPDGSIQPVNGQEAPAGEE
jgi:hypothetical protein